MKLCARFYDPGEGTVSMGGQDLSTLEPESLMKIYLWFPRCLSIPRYDSQQYPIRENDATDEEIIEAAKKAQCHEFITKLSKGYDTMIGEGGCTLSGGEKQRLSIARAILKDAPIVLLDEATASLDPENEVEVQRAINTLIAGRTVIVIAHRLKTICNADTIVVLDEGRIVEKGRHEDLLNNHGLYAHLWDIQTQIAGWKL